MYQVENTVLYSVKLIVILELIIWTMDLAFGETVLFQHVHRFIAHKYMTHHYKKSQHCVLRTLWETETIFELEQQSITKLIFNGFRYPKRILYLILMVKIFNVPTSKKVQFLN